MKKVRVFLFRLMYAVLIIVNVVPATMRYLKVYNEGKQDMLNNLHVWKYLVTHKFIVEWMRITN